MHSMNNDGPRLTGTFNLGRVGPAADERADGDGAARLEDGRRVFGGMC